MSVHKGDHIRRVGVIFSGGPAPAANAVISAAAVSFMEDGREVIGFFHGYSNLSHYHPVTARLRADEHYRVLQQRDVRGMRNRRGVMLGTARNNPGAEIHCLEDLDDPAKTATLHAVYTALVDLGIDGLISIGGDGTLRTANLLVEYQARLPKGAKKVAICHLPKTIDNDYRGIDFAFGFFTAVDFMAKEIENLRADAAATSSWFIVETMGRKAGWLSYAVAIAGEADLVLAAEDVDASLTVDGSEDGALSLDKLCERISDTVQQAEQRGRHDGVVVLAEGLAARLPAEAVSGARRDQYGQISLGDVDLARLVSLRGMAIYAERTGQRKKLKPIQLGYESRCAPPHAFDVMLGSQIGIGAFRALVEEGLDAHMVSVSGQLDLQYVPFSSLIDAQTLLTDVRYIGRDSDLHRLARFLEKRVEPVREWTPGRRSER